MDMTAPIDSSAACDLLSHPIRRRLLVLFSEASVWSITDLATEIAARERSTSPTDLSSATIRRTQIELVHNHVPRLADYGVLEWDGRSGDVVRSDRYEELESIRQTALDSEEQSLVTISDGI